ncbi:MAG: signal peptidase I [Planctomycetota bacterium]
MAARMKSRAGVTTPSERQPLLLWAHILKPLLVVFITVGAIRSAVADWNDVPSQSMEPTILTGDRIFVNRLAYDLRVPFTKFRVARWSDPERGEVVIFHEPDSDVRMVKRVIGLPGDRITLMANQLYVNDIPALYWRTSGEELECCELHDPPPHVFANEAIAGSTHRIMLQPHRRSRHSVGSVIVPDGHYFLLGDNRDNSSDSRVFGMVDRDRIVGRVAGVVFSLDPERKYAPRWDRLFSDIDGH